MDRHLITVDELRAAGALDVPEAWRKSLRVERNLFSGLFEEEGAEGNEPPAASVDLDEEGPSED
jgi:hypothetical protein